MTPERPWTELQIPLRSREFIQLSNDVLHIAVGQTV